MKKLQLILVLLVSATVWSCIEDLEPLEPSFEKVYGFNGGSSQSGVARSSDGNFLVFGTASRSVVDFSQVSVNPDVNDPVMPFIIKVDQHGNELLKRTYPIDQLEYQIADFPGNYNIEWGRFEDVIELPNGKFFAIVVTAAESRMTGYMILDANLNMEKFQLIDDKKSADGRFLVRELHQIHLSPDKNELFVLSEESYYLEPDGSFVWNLFYAIHRISLEGTILDVYNFEQYSQSLLAAVGMTINNDGTAVVVGYSYRRSVKPFMHRIALDTGTILEEKELDGGPWQIRGIDNGYLLNQSYQGNASNGSEQSENFTALNFYDSDFELINSVIYQPTERPIEHMWDLIVMRSGGYCALSHDGNGLLTAHRLDDDGKEIWRWEEQRGVFATGGLVETSDGGVIIVGDKEFNSSNDKITLVKLDPNGNP